MAAASAWQASGAAYSMFANNGNINNILAMLNNVISKAKPTLAAASA